MSGNLKTELEAKDGICPVMSCREAGMRGAKDNPVVLCQGTPCMAWRWGANNSPSDLAWRGKPGDKPRGYCGLAGKVDW